MRDKSHKKRHPVARFLSENHESEKIRRRSWALNERGKLGALLAHFRLEPRDFPEEQSKEILQRVVRAGISERTLRMVMLDAAGSSASWDEAEKSVALARSKGFYRSNAWRNLRLRFLASRKEIYCSACGSTAEDAPIHVDHVFPRTIYPELALKIDNLQLLCESCNVGKGNAVVKRFIPRKGAASLNSA